MNLKKFKKYIDVCVLTSLVGVILGIGISSWKLSVLCLLAFCLTSNVSTVLTLFNKVENIGNNLGSALFEGLIKND